MHEVHITYRDIQESAYLVYGYTGECIFSIGIYRRVHIKYRDLQGSAYIV